MKAMLRAAAALVWLTAAVCGSAAGERWATYVNDRFGFSLAYPADLFVMQPPPENDDGRTLVAADGAKILAFAGYNVANDTLASKRTSLKGLDYALTSYNATGKNWFVVSGHRAIGGVGHDPQPDRHLSGQAQGALRPDRRPPRRVVRRALTGPTAS